MNLHMGLDCTELYTYTLARVQTEQGTCQCQCSGFNTALQLHKMSSLGELGEGNMGLFM